MLKRSIISKYIWIETAELHVPSFLKVIEILAIPNSFAIFYYPKYQSQLTCPSLNLKGRLPNPIIFGYQETDKTSIS